MVFISSWFLRELKFVLVTVITIDQLHDTNDFLNNERITNKSSQLLYVVLSVQYSPFVFFTKL